MRDGRREALAERDDALIAEGAHGHGPARLGRKHDPEAIVPQPAFARFQIQRRQPLCPQLPKDEQPSLTRHDPAPPKRMRQARIGLQGRQQSFEFGKAWGAADTAHG